MTTRVYTKCGIEKDIIGFGWEDRLRGYRHFVCKGVRLRDYQNQDRQKENIRRNNQDSGIRQGYLFWHIF